MDKDTTIGKFRVFTLINGVKKFKGGTFHTKRSARNFCRTRKHAGETDLFILCEDGSTIKYG